MIAAFARLFAAPALLLVCASAANAQTATESVRDAVALPAIVKPVLRTSVTVTSDVVRIGDFVENAGAASQIALFRAPELGMTGAVPLTSVIAALRTHHVIGVDYPDATTEIAVTRASRAVAPKEMERLIASALERRNGLGDAADLQVTTDRDLRTLQFEADTTRDLQAVSARYDQRSGRFDVSFEVSSASGAPQRLRYTGTIVETAEIAVITRAVERGDVLKASDISVERRPKTEVPGDNATRGKLVGMAMKRSLRPGQALRTADIVRPELVQRDQNVMITFEMPGIYLTMRGKANESGGEGDTISITNLQSKRVVQGVIVGPGQVSISPPVTRTTATAALAAASSRSQAE